jgi:fructokinase
MSGRYERTIVAFGEILWDMLPDCTRLGGAPFNFTYRINSLGDEGLMISRLGSDALGDKALEAVRSLGVETSLLQRDPVHPTGTVRVTFDDDHRPDYLIVPEVAYDYIEPTDALSDAVARADCLSFGTLVQRSQTTRRTLSRLIEHASNCLKALDINLRQNCYSLDTVKYSLGHADLLKLNDDEVGLLCRLLGMACDGPVSFCERIMELYPIRHCLVTFGESGALVVSQTGEKIYEPGYRVKLADSLGSGDAFAAGFVHKYLRAETVKDACHFGNVLGAIVATQVGATEPIWPEQIEQFECAVAERNILSEFERFILD